MDNLDNCEEDKFKLIFNNVCFSWPGQKYPIIQNCKGKSVDSLKSYSSSKKILFI